MKFPSTTQIPSMVSDALQLRSFQRRHVPGSVHLRSLLRRKRSAVENDEGCNSMVLEQSDAIHCIIYESITVGPVWVSHSSKLQESVTYFVVRTPLTRSSAHPKAPLCSQTYAYREARLFKLNLGLGVSLFARLTSTASLWKEDISRCAISPSQINSKN